MTLTWAITSLDIIKTDIGDMLPFPKSVLLNAAVKHIKKLVNKFFSFPQNHLLVMVGNFKFSGCTIW